MRVSHDDFLHLHLYFLVFFPPVSWYVFSGDHRIHRCPWPGPHRDHRLAACWIRTRVGACRHLLIGNDILCGFFWKNLIVISCVCFFLSFSCICFFFFLLYPPCRFIPMAHSPLPRVPIFIKPHNACTIYLTTRISSRVNSWPPPSFDSTVGFFLFCLFLYGFFFFFFQRFFFFFWIFTLFFFCSRQGLDHLWDIRILIVSHGQVCCEWSRALAICGRCRRGLLLVYLCGVGSDPWYAITPTVFFFFIVKVSLCRVSFIHLFAHKYNYWLFIYLLNFFFFNIHSLSLCALFIYLFYVLFILFY